MVYSIRDNEQPNRLVKKYDFGVKDRLGRLIGAEITTCETTYRPAAPDANIGWPKEPGTYFTLIAQATRNGLSYGAGQGDRYFKTLEERNAAIDKYLKEANNRALKREGK